MEDKRSSNYGRRAEDDRWNQLRTQLMELVSAGHGTMVKLDALKIKVDELADETDELKDFVLGGAMSGRSSLETRLHDAEKAVQEHTLILKGGDILNPDKGLIATVRRMETGEMSKTTRRGQTIALLGSLLLFLGTLWAAWATNADKIMALFSHRTPTEEADRLRGDIKAGKKDPKTRKRIKEDYGVDIEQQ